MSQEIIEGIQTIEQEKGIEEGTLIAALEDALLAAYKKTPGRHAPRRGQARRRGRVPRLRDRDPRGHRGAAARGGARGARSTSSSSSRRRRASASTRSSPTTTSSSTGRRCPRTRSSARTSRRTNFGRIAAQTAKQVIQQRIREAERAIMYDEYVDRQGEVVTGIVQQAGDRNNVLVDLGRSRRCCRAPSRSTASATSRARASRPSSPRCARARRARR